jgi:hypothetical protein
MIYRWPAEESRVDALPNVLNLLYRPKHDHPLVPFLYHSAFPLYLALLVITLSLLPFVFGTKEDWLEGVSFPTSFISPRLNDIRWVPML